MASRWYLATAPRPRALAPLACGRSDIGEGVCWLQAASLRANRHRGGVCPQALTVRRAEARPGEGQEGQQGQTGATALASFFDAFHAHAHTRPPLGSLGSSAAPSCPLRLLPPSWRPESAPQTAILRPPSRACHASRRRVPGPAHRGPLPRSLLPQAMPAPRTTPSEKPHHPRTCWCPRRAHGGPVRGAMPLATLAIGTRVKRRVSVLRRSLAPPVRARNVSRHAASSSFASPCRGFASPLGPMAGRRGERLLMSGAQRMHFWHAALEICITAIL
jgi:hypothetical protein